MALHLQDILSQPLLLDAIFGYLGADDLVNIGQIDPVFYSFYTDFCRHLTELDINSSALADAEKSSREEVLENTRILRRLVLNKVYSSPRISDVIHLNNEHLTELRDMNMRLLHNCYADSRSDHVMPNLRSLSLFSFSYYHSDRSLRFLRLLARNSPRLARIDLNGTGKVHLGEESMKTLARLPLRHIGFRFVTFARGVGGALTSELTSVEVHDCEDEGDVTLEAALRCRRLRSFRHHRHRAEPRPDRSLTALVAANRNLGAVHVTSSLTSGDALLAMRERLVDLRELSFHSGSPHHDDDDSAPSALLRLLDKFALMSVLRLNCASLDQSFVNEIALRCTNLVRLSLVSAEEGWPERHRRRNSALMRHIDDDDHHVIEPDDDRICLEGLCRANPALEHLHVDVKRNLTASTFPVLVHSCPRLSQLELALKRDFDVDDFERNLRVLDEVFVCSRKDEIMDSPLVFMMFYRNF